MDFKTFNLRPRKGEARLTVNTQELLTCSLVLTRVKG
jgi:hypothetical protein